MSRLVEFRLPDVGEGIAEAEVLEWFVDVGDTVRADAPMCQVETDKSVVEIPAPADGILLRRCVEAGAAAIVGELLFVIGDPGDVPVQAAASAHETVASRIDDSVPAKRPMASPRTRRIAAQRGIDLSAIHGSGPHGRILESDLDAPVAANDSAMPSPVSAPAARAGTARTNEVIELRGLRRSIARSMTQALTIPHVIEFREVDATNLLAARAALRPSFVANGVKFSVLPLLLLAVMRGLEIQPSMNATYDAATETLTKYAGVHLGMATATDDGLIVPVIRDADLLDLTQLAQEAERLADRARTRTATPAELTGGSFTVTNFGSFGTWMGSPVIRPPEVGIAGFGRIAEKPVAVDGRVVIRPMLPIVVATDHRVNDGAHLAEFVNAIAEAVVQPLLLLS